MAAARSLIAGKVHRLSGLGVGAFAGFFSATGVASAASDGGNNTNSACPAYPWPHDGARGGHKAFMQHDCAACHSMLPYPGLAAGAGGGRGAAAQEAKAAEIMVVHEAAQPEPETAATLHGPPDLSVITRTLEGLRHSNLYAADELKKRMALLPTPVWLHFLQPYYMRNTQAA
ncbi:hypothetical protein HU200_041639 [Digitaria exilis]|uniref:Cytochrome c domain-containing protein n=1 Tax=Digitaria exilis TaxID=1010633 RepID=A0A835B4B7_9POAL|nr:hypothetical protein HU200_041639 [Digitaria exilis]CAB3448308.1 unnamed protein product [Digitaria exilis]